jgi:hypothetical protein
VVTGGATLETVVGPVPVVKPGADVRPTPLPMGAPEIRPLAGTARWFRPFGPAVTLLLMPALLASLLVPDGRCWRPVLAVALDTGAAVGAATETGAVGAATASAKGGRLKVLY